MKFKLNENIFEYLNKNNLDEELDPSIDANEVLYEDNDYSKTPGEADNNRTTVEDVLGIGELNGNLVQYLADNWPAFYKDANKFSSMKDLILGFMQDEGLLSEEQEKAFDLDNEDDFDDIDFNELPDGDLLHPVMNNEGGIGFKPLSVLSWDTPEQSEKEASNTDDMADMANELVEDDDFDPEDEELLNNILSKKD